MFAWLNENIGTIAVCLLLLALVIRVIISMIKDKRSGGFQCGGSCVHCKYRCCRDKTIK